MKDIKLTRYLTVVLLFLLFSTYETSFAQSGSPSGDIRSLITDLSTRQELESREAVYVHFDKNSYESMDTIWYKAYVFNANKLISTEKSGILHIDVFDEKGTVAKRFLIPLVAGLGWGHIALDSEEFPENKYTFKAYTNWMLNFGNSAIFSRSFDLKHLIKDSVAIKERTVIVGRSSGSDIKKVKIGTDDLQFMPEGGHLVAGLSTNLGFKLLDFRGKGKAVSGAIFNQKNELIASFNAGLSGMGAFSFNPLAGEKYTARLKGSDVLYKLPDVKTVGTVLNVGTSADAKDLEVSVKRSASSEGQAFYLVLSCRAGAYGIDVDLQTESETSIQIPKDKFPSGIVRVSLLNKERLALNERLVFINHQDFLSLKVATNKESYAMRDSVGVQLQVSDRAGSPIVGSFSVAVTDDAQVNADSLIYGNIITRLLLEGGVQGDIESPIRYFENSSAAARELDLLLLTQGWASFKWEDLKTPFETSFKAEHTFDIEGRVVGAFNGARGGMKMGLLSTKPIFLRDTLTDQNGYFIFKDLPTFEYPAFQIRASNKKDKSFNMNIEISSQQFPDFSKEFKRIKLSDSIPEVPVSNELAKLKEEKYKAEGMLLKEVNIKGLKIIPNSDNPNGPGQADQILNEAELRKLGPVTLLDGIQKLIKGFMLAANGASVFSQPVRFIFDGMDLEYGEPLSMIDLRNELNSFSLNEITGLEVAFNMKYTPKYNLRHVENPAAISYISGGPAYIEITTRAKKGPFARPSRGMFLYRSIPFSLPLKEFYVPKYQQAKSEGDAPDIRSTVYWNPNVLTNEEGVAKTSFYTTDVAGTYTVIIEGSDMNGNLGFLMRKITVQ